MKILLIFLALTIFPSFSFKLRAQTEKDTLNIVFLQSDSLCYGISYDLTLDNPKIKKYRKEVTKKNNGHISEINFYICDELFSYDQGIIDTLNISQKWPDFKTIEQANLIHQEIVSKNIKQAAQTGSIDVVNKSHFESVYIYEKLKDDLFVKYKVTWVDHEE